MKNIEPNTEYEISTIGRFPRRSLRYWHVFVSSVILLIVLAAFLSIYKIFYNPIAIIRWDVMGFLCVCSGMFLLFYMESRSISSENLWKLNETGVVRVSKNGSKITTTWDDIAQVRITPKSIFFVDEYEQIREKIPMSVLSECELNSIRVAIERLAASKIDLTRSESYLTKTNSRPWAVRSVATLDALGFVMFVAFFLAGGIFVVFEALRR